MSWFSEVQLGPPIEVFALTKAYNEDTYESKVNLGVGGKAVEFIEFFVGFLEHCVLWLFIFSLSNQ